VLTLKQPIESIDEEIRQRFFARPEARILTSLPGMGPILGALVPGLCGRHLRLRERRQAGRLRESGPGGPRLGQEGGQQQKDARREQDPKKGLLPLCVL
jgi:hypothetical protein